CRKGIVPVINVPYPHALVLLLYLLRKKKLRMVDLFKKAKMTSKNITREEFFKVIQAVSREELVYTPQKFCSRSTDRDMLKPMIRDESLTGRAPLLVVPLPVKLTLLKVPPVNTEECRPMTDEDIEEVGKHYREWRRLKKVALNPLEWAEQCRLVRCGDRAVDDHCLPSMMEGEVAESINRYRQVAHRSYVKCVKLCREQNIPVTEDTLAKVLLHPGDRIIKEGKHMLKIRQPGAYYNPIPGGGTFQVHPWTGGGVLKRSWKVEEELMTDHILFCRQLPVTSTHYCKTENNRFWPGQQLDKLCYLPQTKPVQGQAMFKHIQQTKPAYPSIYNPYRSWPINERGYLTYGDIEIQKKYSI
uniref:EF-hand calcium binding domain 12 n=1 Tax=Crocodylus porosus TaxID=8502 RepID=A0A7M4ES83_CROPO